MSPAGWILFFLSALIVGAPALVLWMDTDDDIPVNALNREGTPDEDEESDTNSDPFPPDQPEPEDIDREPEEPDSPLEDFDEDDDQSGEDLEDEPEPDEDDENSETASAEGFQSWSRTDSFETLCFSTGQYDLDEVHKPELDNPAQSEYDDRENPDRSSLKLESAVEWLVAASTEAIHQQSRSDEFRQNLESFIDEPRATGAEEVAKTLWREKSPNVSRLIGERFLVLSLGLSAEGPCEMDAHAEAFGELLADTWNDDGLEHPLVHQSIGRMGLLTATPYNDLQQTLIKRIPGRTPQSDDPGRLETTRYNALLLAVAPGNRYPFPQSERGLSRLWHWDEHNPPLADWTLIPPILFTLWIHYVVQSSESDAANDFGALLGNWWEENEPEPELLESLPGVWEALLLTAWVLLPDHQLIWNQIEERYGELNPDSEEVIEITETIFSWVENYSETGQRPEESPDAGNMPPLEWIQPLPSELVNELSQPSFDFPQSWCDRMAELSSSASRATSSATGYP